MGNYEDKIAQTNIYTVWLHIFCSSNITSMWSCKDSVATQSTICIYICVYIFWIYYCYICWHWCLDTHFFALPTAMLPAMLPCPLRKRTDSCGDKGSYHKLPKGYVHYTVNLLPNLINPRVPYHGGGGQRRCSIYIYVYVCLHGCDTYDGNCTACALYVYTYIYIYIYIYM